MIITFYVKLNDCIFKYKCMQSNARGYSTVQPVHNGMDWGRFAQDLVWTGFLLLEEEQTTIIVLFTWWL